MTILNRDGMSVVKSAEYQCNSLRIQTSPSYLAVLEDDTSLVVYEDVLNISKPTFKHSFKKPMQNLKFVKKDVSLHVWSE